MRILLVKDNRKSPSARWELERAFKGVSLTILQASSLRPAMKQLKLAPADVVLLDVSEANAKTATAILSQFRHRYADLPVVAMTGDRGHSFERILRKNGAVDCLTADECHGATLRRALQNGIRVQRLQSLLARQETRLQHTQGRLAKKGLDLASACQERDTQIDLVEAMFESLMEPLVLFDAHGRPIRANPAAVEMLGFDPSLMTHGESMNLSLPRRPDGTPLLASEVPSQRAVQGETVVNERMITVNPAGQEISLLVSASPIRHGGKVVGAVAVWRDITTEENLLQQLQQAHDKLDSRVQDRTAQLKKTVSTLQEEVADRLAAEDDLRRANRWLHMISECDQAMVWAADEAKLLNDVASHVILLGGYDLAWVGLAQQDKLKTVRVVAVQGDNGSFLEKLRVRWDEKSSLSRGPMGIAIRTGQTVLLRDAKDKRIAGLHRKIRAAGLQSAACIPIKTLSGTIGVLGVASKNRDAFGDQELKLLRELTEDLGFGVMSLRTHERRRSAEKALQESNELLEQVFGNTQILMALLDRDFTLLRANRPYIQADGRGEDFLLGKNHFDLYPNDQYKALFQKVIDSGQPYWAYEMPFTYPNHPERGTSWWNWNLVPVKDAVGAVTGLVLSLLDVTEHRKSREILRDTERRAHEAHLRLATLVESSDDAILSATVDGTITSWNKGAQKIWGYAAAEALTKNIASLLSPRRAPFVRKTMERVAQGQRVNSFNSPGLSKSGDKLELSLTLSALQNADGKAVGIAMVAHDMTEQRRLEQQILQVSESERQRIGHDLHDGLGQNLTGLAFLSKVLEQKLASRHLPEAQDAAQIAALLNESTAMTRSLAHGLVPVTAKADGLVTALKELANYTRRYFGIDCVFDCAVPLVVEDNDAANHLYRIAQEAVNNAVRHGKAQRVDIRLERNAANLALEIHDNGKGLPADLSTDHGMGLRIMNYRAHRIGAELTVKPGPAMGTVVACLLPL